MGEAGTGRRVVARAEGVEQATWSNALHDAAGRMGSVVGTVIRASGYRDRHPGSESQSSGNRGADRLLHQHAGDANRRIGECEGVAVAGVRAGGRGRSGCWRANSIRTFLLSKWSRLHDQLGVWCIVRCSRWALTGNTLTKA